MININQNNITGIYIDSKDIISVYVGSKLVWNKLTELLSCYANGYWMDNYPWTDNTPWNNQ